MIVIVVTVSWAKEDLHIDGLVHHQHELWNLFGIIVNGGRIIVVGVY